MKRVFFLVLTFLAAYAFAQEATLDIPITQPTKSKYVVDRVDIRRGPPAMVAIEVMVQDSAGTTDIERVTFNVPDAAHPTATVLLFLTALDTAVPAETGNSGRRANARVLDYLIDHGYLTGVTLVP